MKILSVNIRATQGGAGRMGHDLFRRQRAMGHDGRLLYGYGSGIAPDPIVAGEDDVDMIGTRAAVLANYAAHWLIGHEVVQPSARRLATEIERADIVHVHAAHHWYAHWPTLAGMLHRAGKPAVVTAHDWWLVSGRCGFVRDCEGWRRGCGECGGRRFQDLPSLPDRSAAVARKRRALLRRLSGALAIVCPSRHLAGDHRTVFPDLDVRFIPNALDRAYEGIVTGLAPREARDGYLFCASDLASPGKIDAALVRRLAAHYGARIHLAGRASPFGDTAATDHGEVRDRGALAGLFASVRALVFTSQMDNAPLTLIEALTAGCFVVAYPSPAAEEMLTLVGGRCASSAEEAEAIVREGREAELFGAITSEELASRARRVWSGDAMAKAYLTLYEELIAGRATGNASGSELP